MPPVSDDIKQGVRYWRSLDELADTPAFRERLSKEFAEYDPDEMLTSPTRRSFVKLMTASMALSGVGLSGCRRWPEQKVAPYVERPEGRVPGVPEPFATAMELGGVAMPLLVSSYDGRPIKVEGNPTHPSSMGATTPLAQASVLGLYDPERSRTPRNNKDGKAVAWGEAEAALRTAIGALSGGEGLAILTESTSSPTVAALRSKLAGGAKVYEYESLSRDAERAGLKIAYGQSLRAVLELDAAQVIVCLDADPLGLHPDAVRNARGWAAGRRTVDDTFKMSRMYCVEPGYSVTGTNADDRLAVKASRVLALAQAIAAGVGATTGEVKLNSDDERKFVDAIVGDLKAAGGKGVVTAGPRQPAAVHAAAALINRKIGANGSTVNYIAVEDRPTHVQSINELAGELNAGKVKALVIVGGNPAYDAPAELRFAEAIGKAGYSAHLSLYEDETSAACGWHLSASHWLEAWGDARSYDGTMSVVQPLIMPLYLPNTRSAAELWAAIVGDELTDGYSLVRRTAGQWIAADSFERGWRTALKNGSVDGTASKSVSPSVTGGAADAVSAAAMPGNGEGLELVFAADPSVYDGRFANNGWLQETPDPVSKLVWDNAVYMSPKTAKRDDVRVRHGDRVTLTVGDKTLDAAAFVLPGEAAGSVRVMLGYGRTKAGYVGNGVGFDAHPIRTSGAMHAAPVKLAAAGGKRQLVTTQEHHGIDLNGLAQRQKRAIGSLIREATVEQYQKHRDFVTLSEVHTPASRDHQPLQIFEEPSFQTSQAGEHRWAMAIDLNTCIGCNACMVACQAENNVPVVGKQECGRGREMHWIRVDRYFVSAMKEDGSIDPDHVIGTVHQPLTCQQCENAPCEQVCPVAATVHDTEGLNVMVYNRCIGTRYCSNNCPYKVRRYNWFDWNYKPVHSGPNGGTFLGIPDQQQLDPTRVPAVRRLGFNPEVTVRMRGVMEKCSFCVQRIKAVTIPARNEGRDLADGDITPACAQTCPTQSIVFGDLNDKSSRVSKVFGDRHTVGGGHPRAYEILTELNPRTRNRYLGPVRNPKLAAPVRDYDAEAIKAAEWEARYVKKHAPHEPHDERNAAEPHESEKPAAH